MVTAIFAVNFLWLLIAKTNGVIVPETLYTLAGTVFAFSCCVSVCRFTCGK